MVGARRCASDSPFFLLHLSDDLLLGIKLLEYFLLRRSRMNAKKLFSALFVALFGISSLPIVRADEGMWTFNNVPRAEIKKRYGFDITDEWLKKVQLASVRFNNGGSGSFVSPNGLVLTNYHIVEDIVNDVSTPQKDLAKEGFVARTA